MNNPMKYQRTPSGKTPSDLGSVSTSPNDDTRLHDDLNLSES